MELKKSYPIETVHVSIQIDEDGTTSACVRGQVKRGEASVGLNMDVVLSADDIKALIALKDSILKENENAIIERLEHDLAVTAAQPAPATPAE